jgi:alpha-amylase
MKILHLFQWRINDIIPELKTIKHQGFDAIQISPIQGTKDSGMEWWKLYQPVNLKIGNEQIGSKKDLINLIQESRKFNIRIIVDIVLRHVAGDEVYPLKPHRNVDPELLPYLAEPIDAVNIDNDRWQCTRRCTGLPMLNYDDANLMKLYKRFLDELVFIGVDGFRLDQLKHYALPEEGGKVIELFSKYNMYGEAINCSKELLNKYSKYMKVLTEGRPSDITKLVAKFETHDDYLELGLTKRMGNQMRLTEWDILVNHLPGCDCLYYTRPFETLWKSEEMRKINKGEF